ncbi:response regulator [Lewinella sp. IMCC34183]|uniref:response regulator n=1 Tax=Lewinella sp. IMCC34183 TaxID=2248762 RepID=UPI000E258FD9|nr:response regulator [Lewinella sp. IMCC34183]
MAEQHILIIEDNAEVRENLAEILTLSGFRTTTAADGIAGVKLAQQESFDLILCDVMMPELDGYGVLDLLAERETTAGIPFIFITARSEKEDVRRGMNLGADDYITKPFYKDELLQVIRTRLRKAARRKPAAGPAPTVHLSDPERGLAHLRTVFERDGQSREYGAGATIVGADDYPHFVYRVESGQVHLSRTHPYGRDYIVAVLDTGEYFGIPAVLERSVSPYTARPATGGATCRLLPADRLRELIASDRTVTEGLMHLMARRVARQNDRLVLQAYDSVRRRTALVLCDLQERQPGQPLELAREELAQMVGTTKESAIRALADFRRDGLLETEGRRIVLLDPEGLRNLLV